MLCVRCGKTIPEGGLYCPFCGKKQQSSPRPQRRRKSPNGMGTVRKLKGKRSKPWQALLPAQTIQGITLPRRSIGCYPTREAAQKAILEALDSGVGELSALTVRDAYESVAAHLPPTMSKSQRAAYAKNWERLASIAQLPLRELRTAHLQSVIDSNAVDPDSGRAYSLSQMQKLKQLESAICKWGMAQGLLAANYSEFVHLPGTAAKEKRILTEEEKAAVQAVADTPGHRLGRTARIAMIMLGTGCRIGEVLTMRAEDVHLEDGYMIGGEKTEAGRNRIIALSSTALPYVADFLKSAKLYLITTSSGGRMTADNYRKSFHSLMELLGIPNATPHCCRHTFASNAVQAGIPRELLARQLGHASYETTADIYVHQGKEDIVRVFKDF